jgi:hypothetical protein
MPLNSCVYCSFRLSVKIKLIPKTVHLTYTYIRICEWVYSGRGCQGVCWPGVCMGVFWPRSVWVCTGGGEGCVCGCVLAGGRGVWECVSEGWGWWCAWNFSVENAVSSLVIPVGIEPRYIYIYRNRWTASFQQARNSLGLRLLVYCAQ